MMRPVNIHLPKFRKWPALMAIAWACSVVAAPVAHIQVRVVTGAEDLASGSIVELRIYEAGNAMRRLPLTHGESWPRNSVRMIPLTLTEGLDSLAVRRFGLYYRAANPLAPAWEVVSAEVELSSGRGSSEPPLRATMAGSIAREGELGTEERDAGSMTCSSDADCDDHRHCNGRERCAPRSAGADARGCVKGLPVVCPVNQMCTEEHGCRGLGATVPSTPAEPLEPAASPVITAPAAPQ